MKNEYNLFMDTIFKIPGEENRQLLEETRKLTSHLI